MEHQATQAVNEHVNATEPRTSLRELALLFLRLGATAFGGPAAHIAMMEDEVVRRRAWLSHQSFLDLLGATNLIPGPNSTELAIHIGWARRRWLGLLVAGTCFIVPAMLITGAFGYAYVELGTLPAVVGLLYGVKPVILAVVLQALWSLAPRAAHSWPLRGLGLVAAVGSALGGNELVVLFGAGALVVSLRALPKPGRKHQPAPAVPWLPVAAASSGTGALAAAAGSGGAVAATASHGSGPAVVALSGSCTAATALSGSCTTATALSGSCTAATALSGSCTAAAALSSLFWVFAKIGSVLFGSGYVLLAFLHADLVERLHWLSDAQLVDAIAVGQVTPGPVFTTATFIGYVLRGPLGALVATVGIFLPAFVFVAASAPLVPKLRAHPGTAAFLDGLNVASLALMAVVSARLASTAVVDLPTLLLCATSTLLLLRWKLNSTWLVLGGAALGMLLHALLH